ncbi:SKI2 [Symbiodinium sp. CCMP2592]|nr:SKI2 [Symbiodinium sp. CCMP2592]
MEERRGMVVNTYPGRYSPTSDRPAPPHQQGMMRAFAAASLKDCAVLGPEIRRYFQKSFDREFLASVASRRDLWRILLPLPGIFAFVADRGDNELMIMNDRGPAWHETICNLLSLPVEERERCEIASSYTFTMACPAPSSPPGTLPTLQGIMEASTLDAAKVAADLGLRALILNFAHGYNCGGGFEHASGSQEEAIFRSSSLFLSLWPHRRKDDGPGVLKRGTWIGDFDELLPRKEPFYEHTECGGIYSPYVRLMASDAEVAVATVAAQDVTRSPPFRRELLREKIRTVLWMARENGHDAVVLGAFGCGYFSNPAEVVAETFQQLLATEFSGVFRLALFALLRDRNFPAFTKYFPLLDAKRLPSLLEGHTPAPKPYPE